MENDQIWMTFNREAIRVSRLTHQHLSNILYYFELVIPGTNLHPQIYEEINKKYLGVRLPYLPLINFRDEINALVHKGYTTGEVGADIIVNGKCIGKIIGKAPEGEYNYVPHAI